MKKISYSYREYVTQDMTNYREIDTKLTDDNYITGVDCYLKESVTTQEFKIQIKNKKDTHYQGEKPILRIGVLNDYLINSLNNSHSFDFIDIEELHWTENGQIKESFDSQLIPEITDGRADLKTQFFDREMALNWLNSPKLIKYKPSSLSIT